MRQSVRGFANNLELVADTLLCRKAFLVANLFRGLLL
jgi:hypothetical protein